ncbi:MAG: hypothetical protein RIT81_22315 [Deltaproteobacteria bacterium]
MHRAAIVFLFAAGCAPQAAIPYDLARVETAPSPRHDRVLAILPLKDGRKVNEAPDKKGRFVYNRTEYVGTRLDDLPGNPMWRVTEVLGQHLARTNYFAKVLLVLSRDQAPEADLFLTGTVLRARGYVEANAPDKKSGRPENERKILSEVLLEDLRIVDREGQRLMDVSVGWSSASKELVPEGQTIDPWRVLAKSMRVAITDFADVIEKADLSGAFVVEDVVAMTDTATSGFAALEGATPSGWRFTETSSTSAPIGWTGKPACKQVRFQQRQTVRFHRFLGPYRPRVLVWSCPDTVAFSYDAKADFPAKFVGTLGRARFFVHRVGESNWPKAEEQVKTRLGAQQPQRRHVFELPAAAP